MWMAGIENKWGQQMKKFFLNKRFLYFVTIPLLFFFTGLEAGDRVLYETRFQRTEDMALWTAEGEGALIDYVSRITGNSLKITTRIGDGKKTLWAGPPIKIGGDKNIRLTGWWANNLIWAQDHLYCGVVAATFYDSHGREIKRLPIAYLSMPKKPIRYVNEWFVPDGLFWEFFEGTVEVPPGAVSVKPVFAFSHYLEPWRDILLEGDIWIDDIRIASVDRTEEIFSETEGDVFLGVHTPVEINLFVPSDRVAFNIAIPAESLPEEVDWKKMSLLYEVLNIDRLVLLRGRIPFRETPDRYDKNLKPGGGDAGYWIRLAPDEKIKKFQGQWLAIKVTLTDGKKEYVSGDTGFAILSPRQVTLQQVWNERILCGNVAGKYRDIDPSDFYFGYKRTPPFGDAKRPSWSEIIGRTGLLNLYLFSKETWEKAQPSADSPLDFSSFPDNPAKPIYGRPDPTANRVIPWEERVPSYRFFFHLQGGEKAMPDWVITRDANGNPVTRRKGDKFVYEIDEDAFAEWVLEAVKHTDSTHYVVTSLEGPGYQDYPELVLKSARAIKRWDSRIKVGACGMTGKEGAQKLKELGLLKYLDFLVNDIYSTVVEERAFIEEVHRYNPDFEYILTEYHHMTGRGHFSLARNTIRFITTALGSGVSKIHWMGSPILKNMVGANLIHRWGPDLWSPYETSGNAAFLALTRTTGEGPRLNLPENASSISNIPMLELIAHYHISRLLGSSTGGEEIAGFNKKCKTYRFLRTPETVIVSWTRQGEPAFDALLSSDSTSLEITDITGRVKTLQPFHGKAFITLSEDPLFFHLQKTGRVGTEEAYVQISGLDRPFTRMQGKGRKININLKNSFGSPVKVKIIPSIDIRWKITPLSVEKLLKTGETDRFTFEIEPSEIVPPGRYPFFVEIYAENHLTGWITRSIEVQNNISIQVDSRPASGRVNKPVRTTGKVFYTNLITPEMEPVNMEKEYSIPSNSSKDIIFLLDGTLTGTLQLPEDMT